MSFAKDATAVGLIVVITFLNLLFFLPKQTAIQEEISAGQSGKGEAKITKEQNTSTVVMRTIQEKRVVTSPPLDFMTKQELIQSERRRRLHDTCSRYDLGGTFEDLMKAKLHHFIVDEKYKTLYCSIPKIASTSWKRILLVLRGVINDTYDLLQPEVNNKVAPMKLKYFQFFGEAEQKRMLRDYTKFLVVRDPFSRVLSAFRNKLDPESTFPRAEIWQKGLGLRILNKYKPIVAKRRPVFKRLPTPKGTLFYDITFGDFVKYLVDPTSISNNEHWSEINGICSPCLVNYDIISKFESLDTDAEYILRTIHADSIVEFPSSVGSSPTNSSDMSTLDAYFRKVPRRDLERLYRRFKLDFELFGYGKPDILSHA